MPIGPGQLRQRLAQELAPIYLIFGNEPLQLGEAADAVRAAARERGFGEREVLEAGRDFDWSALAGAAGSLSLFAERRLIELRLAAARGGDKGEGVGRAGAEAIRALCQRPSPDLLVLILAPGLDAKAARSKWVQTLEASGVVVQVRALQGAQLHRWLEARLRSAGFAPCRDAVALLAERVEGNLLAADQEITKLALLREPGPLDAEALVAAVADSARYGVFDLADAALAGQRARVERVLTALQSEAAAQPLVLWALAREVRKLAAIAFAGGDRRALEAAFKAHQVWESRRGAAQAAARRLGRERLWRLLTLCADAELAIKGRGPGAPWALLAAIAHGLAAGQEDGAVFARYC